MSMKKKFLALALAGMVAMPVVANATQANMATGTENSGATGNVTVTGNVSNSQGLAPQGRIEVELPTAMAFTVDQSGQFTAANTSYNIENKGSGKVKVEVSEFTETNQSGGITVVSTMSTVSNEPRNKVVLNLRGDAGKTVNLVHGPISGNKVLFDSIEAGGSRNMILEGVAGTNTTQDSLQGLTNGISEDFVVKFKISKASI